MTIKTKLTLNVIIVLVIIGAVAVTSIVGMGFVKNKLFYLTERSTPFQMRTVEFQRAIQGVTTSLVKVNASENKQEFDSYRAEAEKSLTEVKNAQTALESLSGGAKIETYDELNKITSELFEITRGRLYAEDEALSAQKAIVQRLKDASARLDELDTRIKSTHSSRGALFSTSIEDTKGILLTLRNMESLRVVLKELQLAILEIQKSREKRELIIARGKFNSTINKTLQSEYLKESKKLHNDINALGEKIEELIKLQMSIIGQANGDLKNKYNAINDEVSEKLSSILLTIEQEVISVNEKYNIETKRQDTAFAQSNISSSASGYNSELTAIGITIEALSTKLFILTSSKEVDAVSQDFKRVFERLSSYAKKLEKALIKLDAKDEIKTLQNGVGALDSIKGMLFSANGVISKIRHRLDMHEKAFHATEKLRDIVLKQSEKGKETVTAARGDQEKAIGTVNKMVRFSILLIGVISVGAVVFGIAFGIWVYRSVARPLNQLMTVSENIANGDLKSEIKVETADEVGAVQSSMAKMVTNLREIVGRIRTATGSLASSSEELSATAVVLEKGSQEQTSQTEQSATAMTQMSQTTMDVARNASETSNAAQKMKGTAVQGKEAMDVTAKELNAFADMVRVSASKVESLGHKSEEINSVINLIKEIADQTNLLALNAAIEAARAGEQGRGFAVVADSVRQLAERTTNATEDIAKTVRVMQAEVKESVNFMKEEKESIDKVLGNVNSTLKAIGEIVVYVEQVADMVQRIAVATEEQSSASEEVSHNMENIAMITKQLNDSAVEIKRTSEDLSRFASELNSMSGWFKV